MAKATSRSGILSEETDETKPKSAVAARNAAIEAEFDTDPPDDRMGDDLDLTEQPTAEAMGDPDIEEIEAVDQPQGKVSNLPFPIPPGQTVEKLHPCGLPMKLMNRRAISNYVVQYGYGRKDRLTMVYTQKERDLWDIYHRATGGTTNVDVDRNREKVTRETINLNGANKEFFVTALRLWRAGFPIDKNNRTDINQMAVT